MERAARRVSALICRNRTDYKSAAQTIAQAIAVGVLGALYLASISFFSRQPQSSDFAKFYSSARFFLEGRPIYSPVRVEAFGPLPDGSEATRKTLHPNLNPPFETLLLAPLGLLPYDRAFWVWSVLSLLSGIGTVILLEHATRSVEGSANRVLGHLILLLCYFPTWANILYGQFSLLLLLLVVIAWVASRSGRDGIAGVALGLALSTKLFAGLFLLFFLIRRRWRLLCWLAVTFLICWLVALLVLGADSYRQYVSVLGTVTWYAASWNASFMGFFTRIFGGSENTPAINMPRLAYALAYGSSLLLTLTLCWLAWPRRDESSPERFDLAYSLTVVTMLISSPLGWMYHFPLLLIPWLVAWRASGNSPRPRCRAVIISAWLLSTFPSWLVPSPELNQPICWFTSAAVYFYALLLLGGILIVLLYSVHRSAAGFQQVGDSGQRVTGCPSDKS